MRWERSTDEPQWKRHFAILPVPISGTKTMVWLEMVERKLKERRCSEDGGNVYIYRFIDKGYPWEQ